MNGEEIKQEIRDAYCNDDMYWRHDLVDAVEDIVDENAKLRELVLHMVECVRRLDGTSEDGGCSLCPYQSIDYDCEFENRARDLGVEVDDAG